MTYFIVFELLLFAFLGKLLIFKKISRNSWLGYRTKDSLESDNNWYKYNELLGYHLVICSIIQLSLFLIFFDSLDEELVQGVIAGVLPFLAVTSTSLSSKHKFK